MHVILIGVSLIDSEHDQMDLICNSSMYRVHALDMFETKAN